MNGGTVERLGEDALLLRLNDRLDAGTNARVHRLAARIAGQRPAWLRDLVPAYASLALFVDGACFADDLDPLSEAEQWLRALIKDPDACLESGADSIDTEASKHGTAKSRLVEIAVRYGGEHGPDLADVAAHSGLPCDEVITLHAAGEYTVAMLGFAPGFAYLLGLDPRLDTPRLHTPRTRVPTGSVGIGGLQTGIYPRRGPGGWRLIGRTLTPLFDAAREPPAVLAPGDRVRFIVDDGHAPGDRR